MVFEEFSGKFGLKFLTLILSASPHMMPFVRTFSIYRALGVRLIVFEKIRSYGKIVYIKNIFENGWSGNVYPLSYPPGSAPGLKLNKPSKECGIFQSLGTMNFVLFY